ncbi:MAG: hypothetical protein JRI68_20045, partial [Deltaproteobacteria bacterium]|nr:hypothetical protein [Deltaproteobacteria bacterium]
RKGRVHVVYEAGTKKLIWGGKVMTSSFHMSWLAESYGPQPEEPFSENVYSVYRHVRGPLEDMFKGD